MTQVQGTCRRSNRNVDGRQPRLAFRRGEETIPSSSILKLNHILIIQVSGGRLTTPET